VKDRLLVRLTDAPIDPSAALAAVSDRAAGGTVLFIGTVRDHSSEGTVAGLDYEAWEERATSAIEAIGGEMLRSWPLCKVAILHRTGRLDVGEVSVVVCCSAGHRAEAFEAARHGIERIKKDVPIWKKERLATGDAHWVMGS
jgi:molybdopterin synthase catalytic subunit